MEQQDVSQGKSFCKEIETDKGCEKTYGPPCICHREHRDEEDQIAKEEIFPVIVCDPVDERGDSRSIRRGSRGFP